MKHVKIVLVVFLMVLVISLINQNDEAMSTTVKFEVNFIGISLIDSSEISLYYIIPIAFMFGVIVTCLYGILERYRLSKRIKELRSSSQENVQELNSLRNLPITSDEVGSTAVDLIPEEESTG